jgi:solute carrier family 45 protein 1/2/4
MFTLPPSIRTVCFIQFFANLGWYPVLFWTSLWVSDIYKQRTPQGDLSAEQWQADAVRAGSRALFLQAVITLGVSIGAPFLVSESGIRSFDNQYAPLSRDDGAGTPNSAQWKREEEERARLPLAERAAATLAAAIKAVRSGSAWALPIQGLTLIKFWTIGQAIFAVCMLLTWFTTSVGGAYFVIATTGISWALAGWVPYALLGELVLVDSTIEPRLRHAPAAEVVFSADERTLAGVHSRSHSRALSHETLGDGPHALSRLVIPGTEPPPSDFDEGDTTVILRHSGESERSAAGSPGSPAPPEASTADKAGLILGIHNVFIVLPQFLITAISAVIFHWMDAAPAAGEKRAAAEGPASPDAVGLVFRIGGVSAAAGADRSHRLAKRWLRGEA